MPEVLVVVDMQVSFLGAHDRDLVRLIEREARATLNAGGEVLPLMFTGQGESTVRLPAESKPVFKSCDDGGEVVYAWLVARGLIGPGLRVIVCGVNMAVCVFKTACGIARELHDTHAMRDCVSINPALCGDQAMYRIRFGSPAPVAEGEEDIPF